MNGKMCVRGAGRRGRRPLQVRWQDFSVAESCCYRGLVPSTGEWCSPLQICCHKFVFDLFYSIFKLRSGRDIGYYVLGFAYTKYHNAHPRPDTSTLQPVPEPLVGFTKSQGLYVPASI